MTWETILSLWAGGLDLTGTGTHPTSHSMLGQRKSHIRCAEWWSFFWLWPSLLRQLSVCWQGLVHPRLPPAPPSHNSATRFNRLSPAQVSASLWSGESAA